MKALLMKFIKFFPFIFISVKDLFRVKRKKSEPKGELIVYQSLGEIQSPLLCKYVLNKLVQQLEMDLAEFNRTAPYIDLNDRNAGQYFGRAAAISNVIVMIRQSMQDYMEEGARSDAG